MAEMSAREAYYMWRHMVRLSFYYAELYESGDYSQYRWQVYAQTDARHFEAILHDLTGVWPEYESL